MEETAMQLQIKSLIMIEIFIIHLDPFFSLYPQLHLKVWVPRTGSCTENIKYYVIASLTGHRVLTVPVAAVLAGLVLTIRSAVTD